MKRTPTWSRMTFIPFLLLAASCSDSTAPARPRSTPGAPVANVRPEIDLVARELAVALRDPEFRRAIRSAMTRSPRPERRIMLGEVVRLSGAGTLRSRLEAARAGGVTLDLDGGCEEMMMCPDEGDDGGGGDDGCEEEQLCADDEDCVLMCAEEEENQDAYAHEPPPIEVYLPVEEHEESWTGNEADALVLPQPEDEATPSLVAYDDNGYAVELPGGEDPPITPVISVGYSEVKDESRPVFNFPTITSTRGVGVREYITTMRAEDDHEPWWKGRPEFILLFAGTKDGSLDYKREMPIPSRTWSSRGSRNRSWRGTPVPLPVETWDTTLGSRVKVECIEHDGSPFGFTFKVGGSTEKKIAGATVNVAIAVDFEIDRTDDKCGSSYITVMLTDGTWGHIPTGPYDFEGTGDLFWYGHGLKY